jgi:hypothetical protein
MGLGPFAKRTAPSGPPAERRQSTRIDLSLPIVISGRDATGKPFREVTEAFSVSLHGAALKTRKQILLGMQLTVENPAVGAARKAICVRVAEPQPGHDLHAVAIQLLVAENIWGVRNPPTDWKSTVDSAQPATPAPVATPAAKPQAPAPAPTASTELEQRSADLAESVLNLLRGQAAGILRESLKEFEERLQFLERGAEARIIQQAEKAIEDVGARVASGAEKAVADTEIALAGLRRELLEQLTARTERAILSAEVTMREKIAAAAEHQKSAELLSDKKTEVDAKK